MNYTLKKKSVRLTLNHLKIRTRLDCSNLAVP
jgi:hypothetical protein